MRTPPGLFPTRSARPQPRLPSAVAAAEVLLLALLPTLFPPAAAAQQPVQPAAISALDLATIAVVHFDQAQYLPERYTFLKTVHTQQYIDGKLVVEHTTGYESLFLGGLPYLRRVSVDGQPLEGKDLRNEKKLYDAAVKQRKGLDDRARLALIHHASRDATTDLDRLPFDFNLTLDGHMAIDAAGGHAATDAPAGPIDCLVLDATPLPSITAPSGQRHIRLAVDPANMQVLDVSIEFLAPDNGYDAGTTVHLRYGLFGDEPLLVEQTLDSVVRFKELLGKPIHVHDVTTYTDYHRFRATVTLEAAHELPPDTPAGDPPSPAPKPANNVTAPAPK